jgi:hypothetical protein
MSRKVDTLDLPPPTPLSLGCSEEFGIVPGIIKSVLLLYPMPFVPFSSSGRMAFCPRMCGCLEIVELVARLGTATAI